MGKVKDNWLSLLCLGVLILIVGVGLLVKFGVERAIAEEIEAKFPDRGVPRINITLNGVTLSEINAGSKDVKYEGNELSLYEGGKVRKFGGVQVKGRGNSTWEQEKKPYQIKLSRKVDLFGLGKAKKWILLANVMDTTHLRTPIAFKIEEMLGMNSRLGGEFVELYFEDEYKGLYYLTHAVEIGKSVVDLRDSMGVLVELDNLYWKTEDSYKTKNGDLVVLKDVVVQEMRKSAVNDFLGTYNEFEDAVMKGDYEKVKTLVDIESFAQYYLLSEFTVNPDAYWTSFFMYKDGANARIYVGPGWDFDLAFANRSWGNWMGEVYYSPTQTMIRKGELLPKETYDKMGIEGGFETSMLLSRIMYYMMDMAEFRNEVKRVYREKMSGREGELMSIIEEMIDTTATLVEEDRRKWGDERQYWDEIDRLKRWIQERYQYFEKIYGGNDELLQKNS